jgi:hypothetical protein
VHHVGFTMLMYTVSKTLKVVGVFTGLFKLQDLVKVPPTVRTEMYIRQATPGTYRQVLREIRQKEIYKLIVDTNPRNMQQFFRAVSTTLSNPYLACHNIQRFTVQSGTTSVTMCVNCKISSLVRTVGIGCTLTVGLQGILAPLPIGTKNFSLLHRFQRRTGIRKLCYPKGARSRYRWTRLLDHETE